MGYLYLHSLYYMLLFSHSVSTILGFLGTPMVKNLSAMQDTWVWSLDQEDPLEQEMAIHSSIPAWEIPWTEEPGGLQSMGSQRVRCNWVTNTRTLIINAWQRGDYGHYVSTIPRTCAKEAKITSWFLKPASIVFQTVCPELHKALSLSSTATHPLPP